MLKKSFLAIVSILVFLACDNSQDEKPPISRELFTQQLATFATLEGSYNIAFAQQQNGLESLMKTYAFTMDSLNISVNDFEETYRYYLAKPKELSTIFEEAISIINADKARLEAQLDKQKLEAEAKESEL